MTTFAQMPPQEQLRAMESIARDSLRLWGLDGAALQLLKHRENAVFRAAAENETFALRVHRPGYHSDAALRSELQWIQALADADIAVPRVVPTRSGELFATAPLPGLAAPVQVDLFEWIEGQQLGSVESGLAGETRSVSELYATIGQLAARLHNQSAAWRPPAGFVRHAWDEHGLAGEQPLWGRFCDLPVLTPAQRKLLSAARRRVHEDLAALPKDPSRYSLIHADFSPENLLVDGDRVRLIDFDDAGFGWHLFELVTSLYFVMGEAYFEEAQHALFEGYRSQRPLPDDQIERLPLFYLARSFTYVGWVHTRPETETARELTPMLVEASCELADAYLGGRSGP